LVLEEEQNQIGAEFLSREKEGALTITHPYLAFSVQILSQFMDKPHQPHMDAAHHVLRHINQHLVNVYSSLPPLISSSTHFVILTWDAKYVAGFCIFLGDSLMKKQQTISRSSSKAEYCVVVASCCELLWIFALLRDFQVFHSQVALLLCDSQVAIHIAANPLFHNNQSTLTLIVIWFEIKCKKA